MHKAVPLAHHYEPTDYAMTHCRRCHAGWTRSFANGTKIVKCFLDQELVPRDMTHCDRYDLKEEEAPHPLNLVPKQQVR
jgi:hypothetical protein